MITTTKPVKQASSAQPPALQMRDAPMASNDVQEQSKDNDERKYPQLKTNSTIALQDDYIGEA
jgi:hypothetical protein